MTGPEEAGPAFASMPRITVVPACFRAGKTPPDQPPDSYLIELEGVGQFTPVALGTLIGRLRCAMVNATTKMQAIQMLGSAVCACPRFDAPGDEPGYTREHVTHEPGCVIVGPEAIE